MKITDLATGIQRMEGWFPPCPKYPKGSVSFQGNNPGNIDYPGFVAPGATSGRAVGHNPASYRFALYASMDDGFADIVDLIRLRRSQHPAWTILDFFDDPLQGYAPASDHNDPQAYADFVAAVCGGPATTTLSELEDA